MTHSRKTTDPCELDHLLSPCLPAAGARRMIRDYLRTGARWRRSPLPNQDSPNQGSPRFATSRRECPMKLVRFGPQGREKPGIIDDKGRIRDLSKLVGDLAGEALSAKSLAKIRKAPVDKLPLVKGNPRLGACVSSVGNFIAIGLNYSDHAAEAGMKIPKEPIIFNKAPSCICG